MIYICVGCLLCLINLVWATTAIDENNPASHNCFELKMYFITSNQIVVVRVYVWMCPYYILIYKYYNIWTDIVHDALRMCVMW